MGFSNPNVRYAWPPLTKGLKALLITYVVLYIATLFKGSLGFEKIMTSALFLSWEGMFEHFYLWQPLTYQLLHDDFFHIFFNALVLYSFGGQVEKRWGALPFVRFVLLCGLGGAAAVLALDAILIALIGSPGASVVGASGGIYGVVTAFSIYQWEQPVHLMIGKPIKGKWILPIFLGLDVLFIFLGSPTSLPGHVGGLLMGAALVTGYYKPQRAIDRFKLWRARRRLKLLRGGHPLDPKDDDKPRYLH